MSEVRVGLKGAQNQIGQDQVLIQADGGLLCLCRDNSWQKNINQKISIAANRGNLRIFFDGHEQNIYCHKITIKPEQAQSLFEISFCASKKQTVLHSGYYKGSLEVQAQDNKIICVLNCSLEDYVQGVLHSELPASYQLEAAKAQAVLGRTYALHPRIDHKLSGYDVCDSYLCCQAFNGIDQHLTVDQKQAIEETKGKILIYKDNPALALFSACAGGHTEDYSNCFSDLLTNEFPAPAIPYLIGIPEGKLPKGFPDEKALEMLYKEKHSETIDAWSPSFRWQLQLSADALESHLHHVIETMMNDPQFAPFIKLPSSNQLGHIKKFAVTKRGGSGVAMELIIDTSEGFCIIHKELTIRSIFANSEAELKRLASAKVFFEHEYNKLGLLSQLKIFGLGHGHGVGLQQVGAQTLAKQGKGYEQILKRYYKGVSIGTV